MSKSFLVFLLLTVVFHSVIADDNDSDYSYDPDADNGPYEWPNLEFEDATNECAGDSQSPINLVASSCNSRVSYTFTVGSCTTDDVQFFIDSVGLQGYYPGDNSCQANTMQLPDGIVEATEFHLHVGSEHSINDVTFDAEIHILHDDNVRCVNGNALVGVALLLDASSSSDDNEVFGALLEQWSNVAQETLATCGIDGNDDQGANRRRLQDTTSTVDIYNLIPARSNIFEYRGSLTAPPCSEVVDWHVVETPVQISTAQLETLQGLVSGYYNEESCELETASYQGFTNRSIQSLNGRRVQHICPPRSKAVAVAGVLVGGLATLLAVSAVVLTMKHKRKQPEFGSDKLVVRQDDSVTSQKSTSNLPGIQ